MKLHRYCIGYYKADPNTGGAIDAYAIVEAFTAEDALVQFAVDAPNRANRYFVEPFRPRSILALSDECGLLAIDEIEQYLEREAQHASPSSKTPR